MTDDLDPARTLALIEEERARVTRRLWGPGRLIVAVWGVTWALVGAAVWAALPDGPRLLGESARVVVVSVLTTAAFAASVLVGLRARGHVRGPGTSSGSGAVAWLAAGTATIAVAATADARGLPADAVALAWTSGPQLVAAALLLAAAPAQPPRRRSEAWVAAAILLAGAVLAAALGRPHCFLVLAVAVGAAMVSAVARS